MPHSHHRKGAVVTTSAEAYDRAPDAEAFNALVAPYRPELLAYYYRMIGSIHEAEDLTQEAMLRAWRGYARFEGRSSLRDLAVPHRHRVCLTALEARDRRPLPPGLGAPTDDPKRRCAQVRRSHGSSGSRPHLRERGRGPDPRHSRAGRRPVSRSSRRSNGSRPDTEPSSCCATSSGSERRTRPRSWGRPRPR